MAVAPLTPRESAIASGAEPYDLEGMNDDQINEKYGDDDAVSDIHGEDVPDYSPDEQQSETDGSATEETWIDDEVKGLAQSYGMTDEDLSEFSSREELERFGKIYDRQTAKRATEQTEQPESSATEEPEPAKEEPADDSLIDPEKYVEAGYDDETVLLARTLRAEQERSRKFEQYIEQQQQREAAYQKNIEQQIQAKQAQDFRDAAAELGLTEKLFKSESEATELGGELWATMADIQEANAIRAEREGRQPPPVDIKNLMVRARAMLGDKLAVDTPRRDISKIREQSTKRRPTSASAGASRPATKPIEEETDDEATRRIANDPELVRFWESRANR